MRIFKVLGLVIFTLVFTGILLTSTFPKFLFLDRILLKNDLYLLAHKVKEKPLSLEIYKGKVFSKNGELIHFDSARLYVNLLSLNLELLCNGKPSKLSYDLFGNLKVNFNGFSCSPFFKSLSGNLELKNGISGKIKVEGLKTKLAVLEELSLNFRGKNFTGEINYLGMELKGQGRILLNKENFLDSKVDGEFRGSGITLRVSGKLKRLRVNVR